MGETQALRTKTMIKDRYRIGNVLGANGLGITYKAFDTLRENTCVIKELFPRAVVSRSAADKQTVELRRLSDEEIFHQMAEHMIRQAKTLIRLFPLQGIANVITYLEENNTVYVVSEYVEGAPLSDFLMHRKAERFELAAILNFFSPMTDSLKILHQNQVFHGKIRPDQIMVTPKNGIRLVGFADPMEDVVKPAFLEEKLSARDERYSPVEQFMDGGKLGAYTDVYGLAATVYHCITRSEPMDFYDRIGQRDLMKSPLDLKVPVTPAQSDAMMKALAPHDFERYQTVDEWLDAVYRGAETEEFAEASPVIWYRAPFAFLEKQKLRRRLAGAGVAVLLIALLMLLPRAAGLAKNGRAVWFYQKFVKSELYEQCEMLKWLSRQDRKEFTNDYTQLEKEGEIRPVYYDVRGRKLIGRKEFTKRGKVFEIVEIDYRNNNLVLVTFYDRENTKTFSIDLNNPGEAYQVSVQVENINTGTSRQSMLVDEGQVQIRE